MGLRNTMILQVPMGTKQAPGRADGFHHSWCNALSAKPCFLDNWKPTYPGEELNY